MSVLGGLLALEEAFQHTLELAQGKDPLAVHDDEPGRASPRLSDVTALRVLDVHDRLAPSVREVGREMGRLDKDVGGTRRALLQRNDHVRACPPLREKPQVVWA